MAAQIFMSLVSRGSPQAMEATAPVTRQGIFIPSKALTAFSSSS